MKERASHGSSIFQRLGQGARDAFSDPNRPRGGTRQPLTGFNSPAYIMPEKENYGVSSCVIYLNNVLIATQFETNVDESSQNEKTILLAKAGVAHLQKITG